MKPEKSTITIWKDGTYKIWSKTDAYYAASDPDWLANIPMDVCRKIIIANLESIISSLAAGGDAPDEAEWQMSKRVARNDG